MCSNATQDLGCSSAICLAAFRNRKGAFAEYPETEFGVDTIHFSYCMKALCPFKVNYKEALEQSFPKIRVVIGTHEEHITPEEIRRRAKKLFCQPRKTMVDIILNKGEQGNEQGNKQIERPR
jgi:predicted metal-binding protein